jgi:hypothetical protein
MSECKDSLREINVPVITPTSQRVARVRVLDGCVTFKPNGCDGWLRVPAALLGDGAALYLEGATHCPGAESVEPVLNEPPKVAKRGKR